VQTSPQWRPSFLQSELFRCHPRFGRGHPLTFAPFHCSTQALLNLLLGARPPDVLPGDANAVTLDVRHCVTRALIVEVHLEGENNTVAKCSAIAAAAKFSPALRAALVAVSSKSSKQLDAIREILANRPLVVRLNQ
jgi:hypothetical protein